MYATTSCARWFASDGLFLHITTSEHSQWPLEILQIWYGQTSSDVDIYIRKVAIWPYDPSKVHTIFEKSLLGIHVFTIHLDNGKVLWQYIMSPIIRWNLTAALLYVLRGMTDSLPWSVRKFRTIFATETYVMLRRHLARLVLVAFRMVILCCNSP